MQYCNEEVKLTAQKSSLWVKLKAAQNNHVRPHMVQTHNCKQKYDASDTNWAHYLKEGKSCIIFICQLRLMAWFPY